ncbi:HIT family protein [Hydrogenimonas sp. SS33]|uniref:HIT family protein n=1 Tax=Hydrogenimonas leucolamina TaxID=2954236 RepID=UPI00336BF023
MIYEDDDIILEWEESEIPWIKLFTQRPYRELSECPEELYGKIWRVCRIVEETMIEYFNPDKMNLASFGNYLPRVHIHLMARFENDSYFPEPMWGTRQREGTYRMPDIGNFEKVLRSRLRSKG